jgi:aminodeoxychorismate lyase
MNSADSPGWTWLNDRLVPSDQASVPVTDRGFLYGDSLFETAPVRHGQPFRWSAHLDRLAAGARFLGFPEPDSPFLADAVSQVLRQNQSETGVLRLQLTRGSGRRGYSPRDAGPPTLVITWHASPPAAPVAPWTLMTAPFRLAAGDPLALHKHGSRLVNVLARQAAEQAGADEALLLDTDGHVAETASGNLFILQRDVLRTSPAHGLLPGISRDCVLALAPALGLTVEESPLRPEDLHQASTTFMTTSTLGVVPLASLDGRSVGNPFLCRPLGAALDALVERECRQAARHPRR